MKYSKKAVGTIITADSVRRVARDMIKAGITRDEGIRALEKALIQESLISNRLNQCRAARELHLHRNTLARSIDELQLKPWLKEEREKRERTEQRLTRVTAAALQKYGKEPREPREEAIAAA